MICLLELLLLLSLPDILFIYRRRNILHGVEMVVWRYLTIKRIILPGGGRSNKNKNENENEKVIHAHTHTHTHTHTFILDCFLYLSSFFNN